MEIGKTINDWWDPFMPRDGKFDVIITDNYHMEKQIMSLIISMQRIISGAFTKHFGNHKEL